MLGPRDPIPGHPRRVLVAGVSGVGKSTLARRLAAVADLPYTELDALFHGPGWTPRPQFEDDVRALVAGPAWVTEWQYGNAREALAERADLLVWVDLPFWRMTLPRVVRRTVRRRLRRVELWNGNVEGPLTDVFTDPEHIVRWAVSTRHEYGALIRDAAAAHPQLTVVRLRTRRDVRRWPEGPWADAHRRRRHT